MILHRFQCWGTGLLVICNKYDRQRDFFPLVDYYVVVVVKLRSL